MSYQPVRGADGQPGSTLQAGSTANAKGSCGASHRRRNTCETGHDDGVGPCITSPADLVQCFHTVSRRHATRIQHKAQAPRQCKFLSPLATLGSCEDRKVPHQLRLAPSASLLSEAAFPTSGTGKLGKRDRRCLASGASWEPSGATLREWGTQGYTMGGPRRPTPTHAALTLLAVLVGSGWLLQPQNQRSGDQRSPQRPDVRWRLVATVKTCT